MPTRPPRYDLLPRSVQHALRLRGALLLCGPGVRGVAWPETARIRLAAIAGHLDGGLVAAYLTAAWVWGAVPQLRHPVSVAGFAGRARSAVPKDTRRHEMRFAADEVTILGEFGVTTPLRTILDLLHRKASFGETERDACLRLLELAELSPDALLSHLDERRRPNSHRARQRFREILAAASPPLPVDSKRQSPKE